MGAGNVTVEVTVLISMGVISPDYICSGLVPISGTEYMPYGEL